MYGTGMTAPAPLKYDFSRQEIVPFIPATARRLLDVGCGSGAFGKTVRQEHPGMREMWAIEPDPAAAAAAQANFDHVAVGFFPEALFGLELGKFDCIVFNDVLEHLVDPVQALRSAVELLAAGGSVVASIPNVRHISVLSEIMVRGQFRYTERGILDRTHLRFFTRRTMLQLFADAGLRPLRAEGINLPRRYRPIQVCSGRLLDEFLYPQYVLVGMHELG